MEELIRPFRGGRLGSRDGVECLAAMVPEVIHRPRADQAAKRSSQKLRRLAGRPFGAGGGGGRIPSGDEVRHQAAHSRSTADLGDEFRSQRVDAEFGQAFVGLALARRPGTASDTLHPRLLEHGVHRAHPREAFDERLAEHGQRPAHQKVAQPASANVRMNDQATEDAKLGIESPGVSLESAAGGDVSQRQFQRPVGVNDDAQVLAAGAVTEHVHAIDETQLLGGPVVHGAEGVVVSFGSAFDSQTASKRDRAGPGGLFDGGSRAVRGQPDHLIGLQIGEHVFVAGGDDDVQFSTRGQLAQVVGDGPGDSPVQPGTEFVAEQRGRGLGAELQSNRPGQAGSKLFTVGERIEWPHPEASLAQPTPGDQGQGLVQPPAAGNGVDDGPIQRERSLLHVTRPGKGRHQFGQHRGLSAARRTDKGHQTPRAGDDAYRPHR